LQHPAIGIDIDNGFLRPRAFHAVLLGFDNNHVFAKGGAGGFGEFLGQRWFIKPEVVGNSVIAGHRDTSFTLLGDLKPGDPVDLQNKDGFWFSYRVTGSSIVDSREQWFPPEPDEDESMLTLVTCWPLDAIIPGGPMRYLVFAEEAGGKNFKSKLNGL